MRLYTYFRSSASYRVRLALHLKGASFETVPVHLVKDGGHQFRAEYKALNPMGMVPCLIVDGRALTESMAIIDFLDSRMPEPRLFPTEPFARADMMAFCENINAGIQPLQNLIVLKELETRFHADQAVKEAWVQRWIERGFEAIETKLKKTAGSYCYGNNISAADVFLVPQVVTAKRFKVDLDKFPAIRDIESRCQLLDPFKKAHPQSQPDFEK